MVDTLSRQERGRRMAAIRGKDTGPEMLVRRMVHRLGYRYRLHVAGLPGRPDLVFPGRRAVIFVHGCYWHRHPDPACKLARLPKSRLAFWLPKLEGNRARDLRALDDLARLGWRVLTIWECELANPAPIADKVMGFLGPRVARP